MQKDAQLHPVRFFKEGPVLRRGQRPSADIAEQDHAVQFQLVERAMKFVERRVRRIHRNRSKAFEAGRMLRDELGV